MPLELIDSHTHLDAVDFDNDRDEVVARALRADVVNIVTIGAGYGFDSAKRAVALTKRFPSVYASVGVHPNEAKTIPEVAELEVLASDPKVVAIGETGLDFYRDYAPEDTQRAWFEAQIALARRVKKPLIIHSRDAGEYCLETLKRCGAEEVGGVFHCYAENAEFAKRLADINFIVSFPGSITFKKANELRETVKAIPLEWIMIETDAPYLAPEPHRGKRCESAFVFETAKRLAEIKGITLEAVAEATTANARKFYRI